MSINIVLMILGANLGAEPSWYRNREIGPGFLFFPLTTWPEHYGDGKIAIKGMPRPPEQFITKLERNGVWQARSNC